MQLDMFGVAEPAPRAPYVHPEFAPFPDALIKRLRGDLGMLRRCLTLPWEDFEEQREAGLFLACVDRLPPDRRGDLADEFRAEMKRLGRPDLA